MAPKFGTGLGLTECAGFCTYTPLNGTVDDVLSSLGYDMPVYPMSIRGPMKPDGSSGDKKPNGEIGEICFKGPQTFVAYANNEEAFKKTVSTDGWLYTGDVGFIDERGLHLSGRSKFIIKPKGYQVHPAQVEDALCQLKDKVVSAAVVGQPHEVFSEAIVAFVETKPGTTVEDLEKHMKAAVAAYMRPLHYVLLEPGGIPLNRIAKTDYLALKEIAAKEVEKLRQSGGWDR
jgi:acyl-CoA synthetase (AMP-forming)/AMP-acid ligase II